MSEEEKIIEWLLRNAEEQQVFMGRDRRWYLTYGGGEVSQSAVQSLLKKGTLRPRYSNLGTEVLTIGKTIDVDATMRERQNHGTHIPVVYLEAPKEPKT